MRITSIRAVSLWTVLLMGCAESHLSAPLEECSGDALPDGFVGEFTVLGAGGRCDGDCDERFIIHRCGLCERHRTCGDAISGSQGFAVLDGSSLDVSFEGFEGFPPIRISLSDERWRDQAFLVVEDEETTSRDWLVRTPAGSGVEVPRFLGCAVDVTSTDSMGSGGPPLRQDRETSGPTVRAPGPYEGPLALAVYGGGVFDLGDGQLRDRFGFLGGRGIITSWNGVSAEGHFVSSRGLCTSAGWDIAFEFHETVALVEVEWVLPDVDDIDGDLDRSEDVVRHVSARLEADACIGWDL